MGKSLLRSKIRRRKARPCRRFCSCCSEGSVSLTQSKSGRKTTKTARESKKGFVEVKKLKSNRKSFKLTRGYSVRANLKKLTVEVTRLSEDVLRVLLENGSICACNVTPEGVFKLSPPKLGENSSLTTPTRRLRSTQIQPVVRQNVMDRLRELNADWRSTTCPLSVVPRIIEAFDSIQEPEFSMKTLFLENLSICKKMPSDESVKENVKMHQNENSTKLANREQDVQQLKSLLIPSQNNVRLNQFPMKVKSKPQYIRYRSLLAKPNPGHLEILRKPNLHSLLLNGSNPPPLAPLTRKPTATVHAGPRTPLQPHPSSSWLPENNSKFSTGNPTQNKSQDEDDDVQIIETSSSLLPPTPQSLQKPLNLVDSSPLENLNPTRSAHKRTYASRCSGVPPTSDVNPTMATKPRIIRRKQLTMPSACDPPETAYRNFSEPDEQSQPQEMSEKTDSGSSLEGGPSSSPPKKPKIESQVSKSPEPSMLSNSSLGKRDTSRVLPPNKPHGAYTIVLSDSSDEELVVQKVALASKKCNPINKSVRRNTRGQAASKAVPLKITSKGHSNATSLPKNSVTNRAQPRRNSIVNRSRRDFLSDSGSEVLSSDPEDEVPRYVSRTGRSVNISTGCRSCPGCKVDRPRKEKSKLKPVNKKRKPEPTLPKPSKVSNVFYRGFVHAGSEDLAVESPPLKSLLTAVIHGLTSSDSSDEELVVLTEGRTALVVVPNEDAGEHKDSPARVGVSEEVARRQVDSPVPGVPGNTDKTVAKPITDGPQRVYPDAGGCEKLGSEGSVSATNIVSRMPENSPDLAAASSLALIMKNDFMSDGSHPSTKAHETRNFKSTCDDQDGSLHLDSDAQSYSRRFDANGTPLLQKINVEVSEEAIIPCKTAEPAIQDNEIAASLVDRLSNPLLVDNSSETSDDSAAVVNFDSQEYAECESTCSSQGGYTAEDSNREVSMKQLGCSSSSRILNTLGEEHCSPKPFIEGDNVRREAPLADSKLSQGTLSSPNPDGGTLCVFQKDEAASGFRENLASELGPIPLGETKTCIETQDYLPPKESPLDVPCPGSIEKPRYEEVSTAHHSAVGDLFNQDRIINKCRGVPPDPSLTKSAFQANSCEQAPLGCTTPETSSHPLKSNGDSSRAPDALLPSCGTGEIQVGACDRVDAGCQDSLLQDPVSGLPTESCESQGSTVSLQETVVSSQTAIAEAFNSLQGSSEASAAKSELGLQNESSNAGSAELYSKDLVAQHPNSNEQAPSDCPGNLLKFGDLQAYHAVSGSRPVCQNETFNTRNEAQDSHIRDNNHDVFEIHVLEGCPSCQDEDKTSSSSAGGHGCRDIHENPDCPDLTSKKQPLEHLSPLGDSPESTARKNSPNYGVPKPQGGTFYYQAISNLLIDCLNNMVGSVKLNNREVIIKKVHPESPDAFEMDSTDQEGALVSRDLPSILEELNLPVSLNPRLSIRKLPSISQAADAVSEIKSAFKGPTLQASPDHCTSDSNPAPTKSLYDQKGYPTPIKRLDPNVLSVIKFNDLDIYNDEPSLNDPPASDCVELVSSKGVHIKLNPGELANLENLLNTKISQMRDKCCSDECHTKSFEIDELVFYNDEPPLNLTPVKCPKIRCPLLGDEDLGELVIDNDAPPLNEPISGAPLDNESEPASKTALHDSDCMVISSDDEVAITSRPVKEAQSDMNSKLREAYDMPCPAVERPCKKRFQKKRSSRKAVEAPTTVGLHRSQMPLCEEDPLNFGGDHKVWDLSELDCPSEDIVDEVIIGDGGVDTFRLPSWDPLLPFQSCREVLHQPQVFNRQGKPLLKFDPTGLITDPCLPGGSSEASSSSKNVLSTSQVTCDISGTFQDSQECFNISGSDPTSSDCGDEVIAVPHPETSSSHVQRFLEANKNDDEGAIQIADTDSDDDVILLSDPNKIPLANKRFQRAPTLALPTSAQRILARGRRSNTFQQSAPSRIRGNLPTHLGQVRTIKTASGNSYFVLVVPPNAFSANPRR